MPFKYIFNKRGLIREEDCYVLWNWMEKTGKKDTVTADKKNDEVDTNDHVGENGSSVCHDTIIHNWVPVLSSKNLQWDIYLDSYYTKSALLSEIITV